MNIPVIVVDDQEVDRYLIKRRLANFEDFCELLEATSGDRFLEDYFNGNPIKIKNEKPLLVLLDINMPGRDGFQTIEEIQKRTAEGLGPSSLIVLMFTSSCNERDKERAEEISIVKGYISKPLDNDDIPYIRDIYNSHSGNQDN